MYQQHTIQIIYKSNIYSTEKIQKITLHLENIVPMNRMELYNSVNVQLFQTLRTFTRINVTFLLNAEGNKNKE